MARHLISPLRHGGSLVDLLGFNLDVGGAAVDGVALNQSHILTVPFTVFDSMNQTAVDDEIDRICPQLACPTFADYRFARGGPKTAMIRNAFRQLHSEMRVARYLERSTYDAALVVSPDLRLALDIDLADVHRAVEDRRRAAWTTDVNDADGYTNSFYLGRPSQLSLVLSRFYEHSTLMGLDIGNRSWDGAAYPRNYEVLLRRAFVEQRVERLITRMIFFKIRASGQPNWQGDPERGLKAVGEASRRAVLGEWTSVVRDLCSVEHNACLCGGARAKVRFGLASGQVCSASACVNGSTWTRWLHRNVSSSLLVPVRCSAETFGTRQKWAMASDLRRVCQRVSDGRRRALRPWVQ